MDKRDKFKQRIIEMAHKATFEEVKEFWDAQVESEEKHWGKDYIYSEWKREARERALNDYKAGKPVLFYKEGEYFSHFDAGCCGYGGGSWGEDLYAELYSDGTYEFHSYSA